MGWSFVAGLYEAEMTKLENSECDHLQELT